MERESDSLRCLIVNSQGICTGFDGDEDVNPVDKTPIEDKLIAAYEQSLRGLEAWEITEIVQDALSKIPNVEDVDFLFDVIYEACSDTLERARS